MALEDIRKAKSEIEKLSEKRETKLNEHRDIGFELDKLGVKENVSGSIKRSETYNENLNPIEKELAEISTEIGDIREKYDLEPSRDEMLSERISRLKKLSDRNSFDYKYCYEKLKNLGIQDNDILKDREIIEIQSRTNRINSLISNVGNTRYNARFNENGKYNELGFENPKKEENEL